MVGVPASQRAFLEQEVLACLAAAGRPMTPAQVQAGLARPLAYTTVMTTLSRLHGKRALSRNMLGRAYEYTLVGGTQGARSNMTAHQMLKLRDDESDRAGVLTRFVADLKPEDEKVLAELLIRAGGDAALSNDNSDSMDQLNGHV
jgi:predicted transcriptional regulator